MSGGGETSRAAPLRTPLKRARGRGAGKTGTEHFWQQRLTAIILIPLVLWFVFTVVSLIGADINTARMTISKPWNAILFAVFILTMFWHMRLGVQVVIEDYVHTRALEIALICILNFICGLGAISAIYALARIAFTV